MTEVDKYTKVDCDILVPAKALQGYDKLHNLSILDYGMQVKSSTFECRATSCTIPSLLVAPYVFAAVTARRAKRILLAGFDGYGAGDFHQNEMVNVINCYTSSTGSLPLVAITPSTYPVEQSSLYSPSV